jgi:tRNA G37 N-methylase Trm5
MMARITELAHNAVRTVVETGETVIDATAGNGHDTLFLAQLVGPTGKVFAFDVSLEAIASTRNRLEKYRMTNVNLIHVDHINMEQYVAPGIAAVMFNLGYLPGGDHTYTTNPSSTIIALRNACKLLRLGGMITICAYVGHPGGNEEVGAVMQFCMQLDTYDFEYSMPIELDSAKPRLFVVRKRHTK